MASDKLALIALLVPLYGLPCLTIAIDRSRRKTKAVDGEPRLFDLVGLCLILNFAVLAYYFGKTRGTRGARWGGFALSVLFILISFSSMLAVVAAGEPGK